MKHLLFLIVGLSALLLFPACSDGIDRLDVNFEKMKAEGKSSAYRTDRLDKLIIMRDIAMPFRRLLDQLNDVDDLDSADRAAEEVEHFNATPEIWTKLNLFSDYVLSGNRTGRHRSYLFDGETDHTAFSEEERRIISKFEAAFAREGERFIEILAELDEKQFYGSARLEKAILTPAEGDESP